MPFLIHSSHGMETSVVKKCLLLKLSIISKGNQIEDDLQITNLHCNKLSMLHALGD